MQTKIKTLLISSAITLITNFNFSQEMCFHVSKKSNASELVTYLSEKYGSENAEQLVINIHNYENVNNVSVMCADEYAKTIERFQNLIASTQVLEEKNRLSERLNRFVLISTIEDQIN